MSKAISPSTETLRAAALRGLQQRMVTADSFTLDEVLDAHDYFETVGGTSRSLTPDGSLQLVENVARWRNISADLDGTIANALRALSYVDGTVDARELIDATARAHGITVSMAPAATARWWRLLRSASQDVPEGPVAQLEHGK